ncbi:MAG: GNAT family N-acetyltransferase [Alphaproteobacteria bacterium]|nr:GNAT family N-acetyltransferase [Alphaproteobacteria bacterium]
MDDPKAVRFRGAEPRDVPRLVALIGELFALETAFIVDPARQEKGLRALLASPNAHILAAEANNQVVGMCTVQLTVSTSEGGPSGLIEDVVVDRAWRGKGIGRALLDRAEAWARSQGASRVQLLADQHNTPALDFYAGRGWTLTPMVCLNKKLAR